MNELFNCRFNYIRVSEEVGEVVTVFSGNDINNYYPAIITASVALIAAVLAQFLSHILTNNREIRKDFMDKYQSFYVDLINYLYIFMHIQTNPRANHDLHENVIPEDLIEKAFDKVVNNIKYASPETLQVYKDFLGTEYYSNGIGISKDIEKLRVLYFVLDDILKSSRNKKIFSKKDRRSLRILKYDYAVYTIAKFVLEGEAKEFMSLRSFYGGDESKTRNLNKALLDFDINKFNKILLKHIEGIGEKEVYEKYIKKINN